MYQVTLLDKTSKPQVKQFLELLLNSFTKKQDYYNWKHNLDNQFKIEEYTFCIFQDNLCIATTQVIINKIVVSGVTYRFGILCDGATHVDYRRLGLFEKLLSHINEFCIDIDVAFVYSTGNEKSRKALLKLGFVDFFSTQKASKKIRYNHPALKVYKYTLNKFKQLALKSFPNIKVITIVDYVKFAYIQEQNHTISYKKSEAYLKWRLEEPTGKYKIYGAFDAQDVLSGVIVLKKSKDLLYIVDVLYTNEINFLNQLIQFVSGLAIKDKNITKINSIHNNFKSIKEGFLKNNFKITKEGSSALLYTLQPNFKIAQADIEDMHYMRIDKNE